MAKRKRVRSALLGAALLGAALLAVGALLTTGAVLAIRGFFPALVEGDPPFGFVLVALGFGVGAAALLLGWLVLVDLRSERRRLP